MGEKRRPGCFGRCAANARCLGNGGDLNACDAVKGPRTWSMAGATPFLGCSVHLLGGRRTLTCRSRSCSAATVRCEDWLDTAKGGGLVRVSCWYADVYNSQVYQPQSYDQRPERLLFRRTCSREPRMHLRVSVSSPIRRDILLSWSRDDGEAGCRRTIASLHVVIHVRSQAVST